jgi:hypothetical protein
MKKNMKKLLLSALFIALGSVLYTGCKKDDNDTTAPVITLNGDNPMYVVAIDENFPTIDPGATAQDDKDGDLSSSISVDYTDYIRNVAGDYEIHYEVSDDAGNAADEHREIYNTHTGAQIAGSFNAKDTVFQAGNPTPVYLDYNVNVTSTATNIFKGLMDNFSDGVFTAGSKVSFEMQSNRVTIPTQTPNGTGSNIVVSGSGTMSHNSVSGIYTLKITYTITEPSQPTQTGHATIVSL